MKKWLKEERASMTVYVVVTIFSFMIILTSIFLASSAVRKSQLQTIPKIKEAYGKNLNNIQEIYDEREEEEGYIQDGLVLYLDGINNTGNGHSNTTTTWKDLSGNGNDATLYNMTNSTISGWQEDGLRFDGVDDFATVDITSTPDVTIEVIVKMNKQVSTDFYGIAGWQHWNADIPRIGIFRNGENLQFYSTNAEESAGTSKKYNISDYDSIYYATLVSSASNKKFVNFINGIKVGNFSNVNVATLETQHLFGIGDYANGSHQYEGVRSLNGTIYSVRVYNRALTDAEIKHNQRIDKKRYNNANETEYITEGLITHYDAINNTGNGHSDTTTTWKYLSGNGNDGTLYNIGNSSTSGWQQDGLRLDGIDDYVSLDPAKLTNLQQGTVIVDFELYDWNPAQQYDTVFFKGSQASWIYNHIQISENYYSAANVNTTISNNTSSTGDSLLIPVSLNAYKQIALRWDGTQISNFNNGILAQSIASTLYPADNSTVCYLGRGYNEDRFCNCKIKSLKIYNRALTDEEIAYNYRIDKERYNSVNETDYVAEGLIAHYDVINNTGNGYSNTTNTWKDLSSSGNDVTLIGFDSTSGWKENYIKFDGVDDYALSNNNLGLSGDTALTMCAVAEWDTDNWIFNYPSYMGNTSYSSYAGLSMTMYGGRPALDFWNYRYIANTPLSTKTIYQICLTKEPRSY